MATPTLEEVKARAKLLTDDPMLQGYIDTAVSVDAVESMLENSGFTSFDVHTITRDDEQMRISEEEALTTVKEKVIEESDSETVKEAVREASSIEEIEQLTEADDPGQSLGEKAMGWFDEAVLDWFPGGANWSNLGEKQGTDNTYSGNSMTQMTKALAEMVQREETPQSVQAIVDKVLDSESSIGLTRDEIVAALTADTVEEAINIMYDSLSATGGTTEQMTALAETLGEQNVEAARGTTMEGSAATKEAIEARMGYEGDYAENHDWMIEQGWRIQIDADDNLFYIDPQTNQVLDIDNENRGEWSPITGDIEFLTTTDARAPIGLGAGMFGTAAEGVLNTNAVAGRPEVGLEDWFDLYGNEYTDIVTGKDWEDVLREELGAQGMASYRQALISQATKGDGPGGGQYTEGVTTELHYQYLAGEDVNMFIDMPLEEMTEYQQRFEALDVGYTAKKYGRFDQEFITLVNKTMRQANYDFEGDPEGFQNVLADMEADPSYAGNLREQRSRGGGTSRIWRPPAYLAPDYAELSQAVKTTFEQKLGRAPSNAEIELLSKKMGVDHRGEFDAQATAQRMQFFGGGGQDSGTVQDVNFAARFQEDFEGRFGDELGTLDKIETSRNITQNALGSILSADRAAGYGG